MPYTITDTCIACDFCRPECPVDAITEGEVTLAELRDAHQSFFRDWMEI